VTQKWYLDALENKIKSIDWEAAKKDVFPFLSVQEKKSLALWSTDFFWINWKSLIIFKAKDKVGIQTVIDLVQRITRINELRISSTKYNELRG
jgi:hypothetical protein